MRQSRTNVVERAFALAKVEDNPFTRSNSKPCFLQGFLFFRVSFLKQKKLQKRTKSYNNVQFFAQRMNLCKGI